jgi:hypothetical protein
MIVDKKIDLNIYKERHGEQLAASCCVPSLKTKTNEEPASCCAPSSSCCSTEPEANTEAKTKETLKKVGDLDFNEWVSKYNC